MEIREMTALELGQKIRSGEVKVREAAEAYLDAVEEKDGKINAYITVTKEDALARADEVQKSLENGGFEKSRLAGVPVAIKDNLCTEGVITSAASHILDNFIPPYSATAVLKAEESGAVMLGKTNMDEFAMGGSTETSYFGACGNPWDTSRVPGGSSGGSAAAVAAGMAPYALGSDTGGSIRQPSAFNGLTGIKPTYGSVSRYGLLAYASSLDQIGPIAHDVKDCAAVLEMISGRDDRDSTSIMRMPFDFSNSISDPEDPAASIKGMKIGIPSNCFGEGLDLEIKEAIINAAKLLESEGAVVEEFKLPDIDYAVPAYYIIACAEASSNLSRYDGIKYGLRTNSAEDILETYYKSRSEGFGTEVKRRIMLGSFVLSSGYFDAYYKKALQVRGLIKRSFDDVFSRYDMVISPVSPTTAYKIGGQISDPVAMYMADIYTVSVNLTGVPSISLPCGFSSEGLPIGMQFIGDSFAESKLIKAASAYQEMTDFHRRRPASFAQGGADELPEMKNKERSAAE